MAPEQALNEPIGPSTDLYALGVIVYELLAGRPPFEADTPSASSTATSTSRRRRCRRSRPRRRRGLRVGRTGCWRRRRATARSRPPGVGRAGGDRRRRARAVLAPGRGDHDARPRPTTRIRRRRADERPRRRSRRRSRRRRSPSRRPAAPAGSRRRLGVLAAARRRGWRCSRRRGRACAARRAGRRSRRRRRAGRRRGRRPVRLRRRRPAASSWSRCSTRRPRGSRGTQRRRCSCTSPRRTRLARDHRVGRRDAGPPARRRRVRLGSRQRRLRPRRLGRPRDRDAREGAACPSSTGARAGWPAGARSSSRPRACSSRGRRALRLLRARARPRRRRLRRSARRRARGARATSAAAVHVHCCGGQRRPARRARARTIRPPSAAIAGFGTRLRVGDVDGDQQVDLVEGGAAQLAVPGHALVLPRARRRAAPLPRRSAGPSGTSGLAVADVNGDGYADIVQGDSAHAQAAAGLPAAGEVRLWLGGRRGPSATPITDHAGHARDPGHERARRRVRRGRRGRRRRLRRLRRHGRRGDGRERRRRARSRSSAAAATATRPTATASFDQDSPKVPGEPEPGAEFGSTLAVLNLTARPPPRPRRRRDAARTPPTRA